MKKWLDDLIHHLQGHISVTVMADGELAWSGWAVDVFTEHGTVAIDVPGGDLFEFQTSEVDVTVTA
jgi:hypothetical protein